MDKIFCPLEGVKVTINQSWLHGFIPTLKKRFGGLLKGAHPQLNAFIGLPVSPKFLQNFPMGSPQNTSAKGNK